MLQLGSRRFETGSLARWLVLGVIAACAALMLLALPGVMRTSALECCARVAAAVRWPMAMSAPVQMAVPALPAGGVLAGQEWG